MYERRPSGPEPAVSSSETPRGDPAQAFHITCAVTDTDPACGAAVVSVAGTLTFTNGAALWETLHAALPGDPQTALCFDLSAVDVIDGGAMALLVQTKWDRETAGARCEFVGASGATAQLLELLDGDASPTVPPARPHVGYFGQLGNRTLATLREVQLFLAFLGSMVLEVGGVLRRPRTANWKDVAPVMTRTGVDAVPIIVLITFLIGFVMAFQSAVQLKQFGANIYVADLVALSITRELGPLMVAIVVSGRSGAAFAAELGTMKVSEEIDALRTMGIGPLRFLVFPRVLALFLVMPVLTLIGDVVGILGGLVVGVVNLDITVVGYLHQTQRALDVWDVFQGLIKASVFGLAIGLISCSQGLITTGGAEGVGRRTTAAVVASLFTLILLDAAFAITLHELGL